MEVLQEAFPNHMNLRSRHFEWIHVITSGEQRDIFGQWLRIVVVGCHNVYKKGSGVQF